MTSSTMSRMSGSRASVALRDGRKITDMDLGVVEKLALKELLKKVRGTDIEKLLAEHGAI